jgi:outer membrane protein OmpA-like peptidoglycan-associated protein
MGSDDIYGCQDIKELEFECRQLLAGIVTDEKTGVVFVNSKVTLYDEQRNILAIGTTDSAGLYSFKVDCGKSYFVLAEKEEYQSREVTVTIPEESGETHLPIAQAKPEPVQQPVVPEPKLKVGDDLAKTFGIQQIYFDLGKYNIRPDAAVQLEKIISFMNEYPTAKIDIRSHTDCRASDKYNDTLSENRAKSIQEYLVKNGIDPARLTGRGYGERQLVNKCADGVKCTEDEHQQNRRSEFIIVEI